jgi:hypothetical protein
MDPTPDLDTGMRRGPDCSGDAGEAKLDYTHRRRKLRVRGQPLESLFGGDVMLVVPERSATERQRVAFEATEQERSTRQPPHIVSAEDDARQIPDRAGHTRFEREDLSLGGPAGMLPPEVPEDSDQRDSSIDGGSNPVADLSQDGVGGLLARHGVKAITSPEIVGWEPAAFEAGQDARVRRLMPQQDADLVALDTRREKPGRRVKLLMVLPEVPDVVTGRRERVGDAQRNAALERRSTVRTSRPEKREESAFLSGMLLSFATPELPERTHHELDLRQVRAAPGARPQVLVATRTLGRG